MRAFSRLAETCMEFAPLRRSIKDLEQRAQALRGYL